MTKEKEDKKVNQNSEINLVKRALNRVAKTKDGQIFINYLMKICGFSESSIVINPNTQEINSLSSIYNEAMKIVYYKVRKLLDNDLVKEIEYLQLKENIKHDNE